MPITISDIATELQFTEYHKRRGELRDCLKNGVYPNLKLALDIYARFVADYGPGGQAHDPELWAYYLQTIEPVATMQDALIQAAATITVTMETVETAAPGTFGIPLPAPPEPEPEPE